MGQMSHDFMDLESLGRYTLTSFAMQGNATTFASNRISYFLNQRGPSVTYNTACSSSLVAFHYAVQAVRNGECSWAIAGGSSVLLDPRIYVAFTDWGTMSPDGKCFTFDERANGYVRGEGAGVVILKRLSDAIKNGDRIYSIVRNTGINHDGHKRAITIPNSESQEELMKRVYKEVNIDVCNVDYIEAHGTGTVAGDSAETLAIGNSLCPKERKQSLLIGSVKTNLGHMEGAAGILSIIKTALSIYYSKIPRNLNFNKPNPKIDFSGLKLRVPIITEQWPNNNEGIRRAGINSFGIGGSNAHVILENNTSDSDIITSKESTDSTYYIPLSASSDESLMKVISNLSTTWSNNIENNQILSDISYTLAFRKHHLSHRGFICDTKDNIQFLLSNITTNPTIQKRLLMKGTTLENKKRDIIMIFCGQGAQWKKMGLELYKTNEIFKNIMDKCCDIVNKRLNIDLWSIIQTDEINQTIYSQPSTTALEISIFELLKSYDIHPTCVCGHSSGEIASTYASGCITLEEAMIVAMYRGKCIQELCPNNGGMAALGTSPEIAEQLISTEERVWIACYNSPNAVTLSGDKDILDVLGKALVEDGYFYKPLEVSHAYHSPHMEPAMKKYKEYMNEIGNNNNNTKLQARVFSSVIGDEIKDSKIINSDYFIDNLTHPVKFQHIISKIYNEYPDAIYLEIGPHPTLRRPIIASCNNNEISETQVFGSLTRDCNDITSIKKCIGQLYCNGNEYETAIKEFVPQANFYGNLPIYPYEKQRLWKMNEEAEKLLHSVRISPLLGIRQSSPYPLYKSTIDLKELTYLLDHKIMGSYLAPAAMYLEMSFSTICNLYNTKKGSIYYSHFQQPLILNEDEPSYIFTQVDTKSDELTISTRKSDNNDIQSNTPFITYYKCHIRPEVDDWCIGEPLSNIIQKVKEETVEINISQLYTSLSAEGLEFGDTFHSLSQVYKGSDSGICNLSINNSISSEELSHYVIHPIILDALFQSMICTLSGSPSAYIPIGCDSMSFDLTNYHENTPISIYVKRVSEGHIVEADVWMYCGGLPFVWSKGCKIQSLVNERGINEVDLSQTISEIKYEEIYPSPPQQQVFTPTAESPLLLLTSMRRECQIINGLAQTYENSIIISGNETHEIPSSISAACFVYESDTNFPEPIDLDLLLSWTQDLLKLQKKIKFFIVTLGANGNTSNPATSSLIGYGRTLQNETNQLETILIDLDNTKPLQQQLHQLITIISSSTIEQENEIIERGEKYYSPRVIAFDYRKEIRENDIEPKNGRWILDIEKPGLLDTFIRTEGVDRELKPDEILWEVEYAGLNYKDVMISMGLLKEDAFKGGFSQTNIGMEGSGKAIKVGKDVKKIKVGDKVYGICPDGFGTHAITPQCWLFKVPKHLSLAEVAGVFVPYVTAYSTLSELVHINKNDIVLIHGGSGGVGSCAIQVAKNAGATVICTASTTEKKNYCKSLGCDYVFDSRSSTFVSNVKKLTDGKGCNVILNCLSNHLMRESVRLLAPYGHFIEIGKIDAMNDNTVNLHDLLENETYIFYDLDRYLEQQRATVTKWGEIIDNLLESKKLKPMPTTIFSLTQLNDAIRYLAQSKHIGKVLVQIRDSKSYEIIPTTLPYRNKYPFSSDYSYCIAGGNRGIGIELCRWMVNRGARNIIILCRSGKCDKEGEIVLSQLQRKYNTKIRIYECDITDSLDVQKVIQTIQSTELPLKGIIHSAMSLEDHLISTMNIDLFNQSYEVKCKGAWNLHYYSQELIKYPLDFFICLSSISSVVGNPGQSNYCAGNSYIEGLMEYRRSNGLCGLALNLGAVRDAGAVFRNNSIVTDTLKEDMISVKHIESAIYNSMKYKYPSQVIVCPFSDKSLGQLKQNPRFIELIKTHGNMKSNQNTMLKTILQLPQNEQQEAVTHYVKTALSSVIGLPESSLRNDQSLTTLGIDSIVAVELKTMLDTQFEMNIPVFELTNGKTIQGLIDDISKNVKQIQSNLSSSKSSIINISSTTTTTTQLYSRDDLQRRQEDDTTTEEDLVISTMNLQLKKETSSLTSSIINNSDGISHFDWRNTNEYEDVSLYLKWLKWNPYYFTQTHITPTTSDIDGYKNVIDFTSYDYLGFSTDESIIKAGQKAICDYGTSVSASRLTGGQVPIHTALEKAISDFLGVEDSIVYLGGHTANVNTIKTLFTKKDLIMCDELSHNSIMEGIAYSGSTCVPFKHNDYKDLDRKLTSRRKKYEKVLIVIEGIYSMDGDIPNLPKFIEVKDKHNCILMVDEAHSIGVLGDHGKGISEHYNINAKSVEIWMGSLGKAMASAGGYIAGQRELITILRYRSPGFMYSIGLPPSAAGSALASIETVSKDNTRVITLHERCLYFKKLCVKENIDIGESVDVPSAVVSVFVGDTEKCIKMLQLLREEGVLVTPGMWPAVAQGKARLRFFVNAKHSSVEIKNTVDSIKRVFNRFKGNKLISTTA